MYVTLPVCLRPPLARYGDVALYRVYMYEASGGGGGFGGPWLSGQNTCSLSRRPWVRSSAATLGFYFSFTCSWLTNVDGMKDLWCSSTVRLLSTWT